MTTRRQYINKTIFKTAFLIVVCLGIGVTKTAATKNNSQTVTALAHSEPIIVEDSRGFEMVYIQAATFEMGIRKNILIDLCVNTLHDGNETDCIKFSDDINVQTAMLQVHPAKVNAFWIDRYEVTIEQYKGCIQPELSGCREIILSNPMLTDNPSKPRTGVTWYDAMLFCNTRGARLPSEAEWEYAAKGSQSHLFPWGNFIINAYSKTTDGPHLVGKVSANQSWAGVYDLSGNVSQWVEDRFQPYDEGADNLNGFPADDVSRVVRGGSWKQTGIFLLNSYRTGMNPNEQHESIGFRCARTTDPRK